MSDSSPSIDTIEQIAKGAGKILLNYFRQKPKTWNKTPYESITEADKASEEFIIREIRRLFPKHSILSEEQGQVAGDSEHVWIVDPLDGTLKFLLGEPYFCVSIAYEDHGVLQTGVVFNPCTDDCYTAVRGGGAFRNGQALRVSTVDDLSKCVICCDWGGSAEMKAQGLAYLAKFLPPTTRGFGINFSPALDLCNLAEGSVAAVISNGTTPEDHAAGSLIAQEAGACLVGLTGQIWSLVCRGILAVNTVQLQKAIQRLLASSYEMKSTDDQLIREGNQIDE